MALTSDINAAGEWLIEKPLDAHCDGKVDDRRANVAIRPQPSGREL
ncbi:MAG: hypothetical protein R3179_02565 [Sedimenticolaceae bacterium]|nr:hypothetical protein [Sedimenticolaceae bacterium]